MKVIELTNKLRSFLHNKLAVNFSNLKDNFLKLFLIKNTVCIKNAETIVFFCELTSSDDNIIIGNCMLELKSINQDYVLMVNSTNGCYVVTLLDKRVYFWCDGLNIVLDDYLKVGHDQIIVFLKNEQYFITDFDCCEFDTRKEMMNVKNVCNMEAQPQNYAYPAIVNSLSDKISQCLNQGQVMKSNIQEKENLIKQSWNIFMDLSLDKRTSNPKLTSLVPLFNNQKIYISKNVSTETFDKPLVKFKVLKHWIRKIGKVFVFGFKLKHTSEIGLFNCSLTLVLKNKSMPILSFVSNTKYTTRAEGWMVGTEELFFTSVNIPLHENLTSYNFDINFQCSVDQKRFVNLHIDTIYLDRLKILSLECVASKDFYMRDVEDNLCYDFVTHKKSFVLEFKITSFHSIINHLCLKFNCTQMAANDTTVLTLNHIQGKIHFHAGTVSTTGTIFALSKEKVALLTSELKSILPTDVTFRLQAFPQKLNQVRALLLDEVECRIRPNDVIILDSPPQHSTHQLQNKILKTDSAMSQILDL